MTEFVQKNHAWTGEELKYFKSREINSMEECLTHMEGQAGDCNDTETLTHLDVNSELTTNTN